MRGDFFEGIFLGAPMLARVFASPRMILPEILFYAVCVLSTGLRLVSLGLPFFTIPERISWAGTCAMLLCAYLAFSLQFHPSRSLGLVLALSRRSASDHARIFGTPRRYVAIVIFLSAVMSAALLVNVFTVHVVRQEEPSQGMDSLLYAVIGRSFIVVLFVSYFGCIACAMSLLLSVLLVLRVTTRFAISRPLPSIDHAASLSLQRRMTTSSDLRSSVYHCLMEARAAHPDEDAVLTNVVATEQDGPGSAADRWNVMFDLLMDAFDHLKVSALLFVLVLFVNFVMIIVGFLLVDGVPLLVAFFPLCTFAAFAIYILAEFTFSVAQMRYQIDHERSVMTEMDRRVSDGAAGGGVTSDADGDRDGEKSANDFEEGPTGCSDVEPKHRSQLADFASTSAREVEISQNSEQVPKTETAHLEASPLDSASSVVDHRLANNFIQAILHGQPSRDSRWRKWRVLVHTFALGICCGFLAAIPMILAVAAYRCVDLELDPATGFLLESIDRCNRGSLAFFLVYRAILDICATSGIPFALLMSLYILSPNRHVFNFRFSRARKVMLVLVVLSTVTYSLCLRLFFIDKWYRTFPLYPLGIISIILCTLSVEGGDFHQRRYVFVYLLICGATYITCSVFVVSRYLIATSVAQQLVLSLFIAPALFYLSRVALTLLDVRAVKHVHGRSHALRYEFFVAAIFLGSMALRIFYGTVRSTMQQGIIASFVFVVEMLVFSVGLLRTSFRVRRTSALGFEVSLQPDWLAFRRLFVLTVCQFVVELVCIVFAQTFIIAVGLIRFSRISFEPFLVGSIFVLAECLASVIIWFRMARFGVTAEDLIPRAKRTAFCAAAIVVMLMAVLNSQFQVIGNEFFVALDRN